jgi:hypothetical protein
MPLRLPQMAWQKHTKFHDDWFRNPNNIKGITSTAWEAVMLVLLLRGISYVRRQNGLRWHDRLTRFHSYWLRLLSNIMIIAGTISEAVMLVILIEGIYKVCRWDGFGDVMYIPSFMIIYRRSRNIKICFGNFKGCNIDITDGRNLRCTSWEWVRCHDIRTKFHKDWFNHSKFNYGDTHTDT